MTVAFAPWHHARDRVLDDGLRGDRCAGLYLSDLDELALTRSPPMVERRQERDGGVHSGDGIGRSLQVAGRAVRMSRGGRHAGHLFEVQCPTHVVPPRPHQAEAGHADHDDVRVDLNERVVVQTEVFDDARREVLHDDVGLGSQGKRQLSTSLGGQVQGDVTLVEIRCLPKGSAFVPVIAGIHLRARIAEPVGSLDGLDLHDVGAERAEVAREVGTRPERGQVEDLQAIERQVQRWSRVGGDVGHRSQAR